jgi:Tol biopolymer transport system component
LIKLTALLFFSSLFAQIEYRYHPELNWKRFETKHFAYVFHEGTKRSAFRVAEIAESIYEPITTLYKYTPEKKITFIIKDVDDYSNGGAYFLDDKIEIWTEHLDFDLRGTHDWLKDVVTHEFIHMIHIQKSFTSTKTIPFAILQWVGYENERRKDVVRGFPNRLANVPLFFFNVPPWLAEGVAQHQLNSKRYDYRDAQREMILRDRFVSKNVLSLEEMNIFGKSSVGNESVYNQGFSLVQFIIKRFGEDILAEISANNASIDALFDYDDAVFVKSTGLSLDSIYTLWKEEREAHYKTALSGKEHIGTLLEHHGEGNFYPAYSDDGKYIAYLGNGENSRLSQNNLIIYNRQRKEKTSHIANISSQIRWLPNKHQLIYSRKNELNNWGSSYNDLYIYDVNTKKETRITQGLRARNAVVLPNNELVFITAYDGSANLMRFSLGEKREAFSIDKENFKIENGDDVWVLGSKLSFITRHKDFTQYFHPIASGNRHIITDKSTGYNRSIVKINIETGAETRLRASANADYRNPFLAGDTLYFSSSKTGIFNIYRAEGEKDIALTNAIGGAFMPSVSGNELSYSLYKNAGFKIAQIAPMQELEEKALAYQPKKDVFPLGNQVLEPNFKADTLKIIRQKYNFNSFYAIPRILLDDKRPKFGFAFLANELLDKSSLYFTAVYNSIGERDIYAGIEVRNIPVFNSDPVFFLDIFNQSVKIDDRLRFRFDENGQTVEAKRPVEFILWQYETGFKLRLFDLLDWKFNLIWSKYDANLAAGISQEIYDNGKYTQLYFPFLRYSYHKGQTIEQKFLIEEKDKSYIGEIVPRSAYRSMLTISKNSNEFLDGFAFNTTGIEEIYTNYNYFSMNLSAAFSMPTLWKNSGLTVDLKAASNFSKVDDFYDHYVGGWIGLKGYPYFAIHGQHSFVGSIYLNQLLAKDAMFDLGFFRVKNLAVSAFGQWGDAWTSRSFDYKSNVGFQIKASSYGPTKIFLEAVKPMNRVIGTEVDAEGKEIDVVYSKEWRYYFGLMYDFELKDFL